MPGAAVVGFPVSPMNGTIPPSGYGDYSVFTASAPRFSSWWPEAVLDPLERRWDLLGLGLCPAEPGSTRRSRLRSRETDLSACLHRCEVFSWCKLAAFSQTREECVLLRKGCAASDLTWHSSFATFGRVAADETLIKLRAERVGPKQSREVDVVHIFSFASPRVQHMYRMFLGSMHLAEDEAVALLLNTSDGDTVSLGRTHKSWPHTAEDYALKRTRDHRKVQFLVQIVWWCLRAGLKHAVFSDVDMQVFPGWTQVIKSCTSNVHVCLMQQPGLFMERRRAFNGGFLGFGVDMLLVSLVLRLAASYESYFLAEDAKWIRTDQEMINEFFFNQGHGYWATFNPHVVGIWVNYVPYRILRFKVQHACGSVAGSRPKSMYRSRRQYYTIQPLCLSSAFSGPQHPCCVLYGYQRSIFQTDVPTLPPFLRGTVYGQSIFQPFSAFDELGEGDDEAYQVDFWTFRCHQISWERSYAWTLANPQEEFLKGFG